jgi:hypothetical protein
MSTPRPNLETALVSVPAQFRKRLVDKYLELKDAFVQGNYDACVLRAGKYCEVLLRFLQFELTGAFTPFGEKITNFSVECRNLEKLPKTSGPETFRVIIPRSLDFIYTLRNKRDIGHVGGDIDANVIDAATSVRGVDWTLAELIRVVHTISLEEAQQILDSIATKQIPMIWAVSGIKRVLNPKMAIADQTLVLLYSDVDEVVLSEDLCDWTEASNFSNFRRTLRALHSRRLIEYNEETETVILSPTGKSAAEALLQL